MKKRFLLVLALVFVGILGLAACGKSDSDEKAGDTKKKIEGEVINAGTVSALCPEGWKSFGMKDLFSDDENAIVPNKLEFRKGSKSEEDHYKKPGFTISYYDASETFYELDKDSYTEVEEIEATEIGGKTWEGFSGVDGGYRYTNVWTGTSESDEFLITFMMDYGGEKISLDDAAVHAIIESIKIN